MPSGDATQAFDELNEILKQAGIFIVPVGELECFVKQVGGHGPDWTNKVLEKYPDLSDRVSCIVFTYNISGAGDY